MVFQTERLQNGDTLSQAWANSVWEMEWSIVHHNEYPIEDSGAKGKGDKKGKKRPRDDDGDKDPDRGWQSRCDAANTK